jgi:hypothetical protein
MDDENDIVEFNLTTALGAEPGVSIQCFSAYIPNKDKNGIEVADHRRWVLECRELLAQINGGASVMPPIEGGWVNDSGVTIWENPVVVYSFVHAEKFLENLPRIREFLHRMGRETNQGEVAFEFGSEFFRIRNFDAASEVQP